MSKQHKHTYDAKGNITCCTSEEKIRTTRPVLESQAAQKQEAAEASHGHDHNHEDFGARAVYFSLALLLIGLAIDHLFELPFFKGWVRLTWYLIAYIPVALPVIRESLERLRKKEIFTEFFLMSIATIGAFVIGEYPEGVAVMLFYTIGELFQAAAVKNAKKNISALLDVRPKLASVFRNNLYQNVHPEKVFIGEKIQVKVGEKIPLDGTLLSAKAILNTAALTGESKPQSRRMGSNVLAGSINLEQVIEVKVEKKYADSSISRILDLVQNATAKKAKTELLIRRLAKVYTPIVGFLAIAILFIPYFFSNTYIFTDWLYRALIFLVISCPCALVISIPLGYFGGLGAASKNGILFKGATFLDQFSKINTLVMDKTGTVTKGVFNIKTINVASDLSKDKFMNFLIALETKSTHPIAKAIKSYGNSTLEATEVEEIAGKGLKGMIQGQSILAGNKQLMDQFMIDVPNEIEDIVYSIVLVAINQQYAGYVIIADELKDDARRFVNALPKYGISNLVMLSGDKEAISQKVANELGIKNVKGGLLPEDKLIEVEKLKRDPQRKVAFVGDGINDAPVLAASDIGIAMGALGSDVAIETADVIIQTDQPSKILTAIKISKYTQQIIWQNIAMAFGVKILVLILGALGLATMWAAVFADVGVALLAILNAIRIQRIKYA